MANVNVINWLKQAGFKGRGLRLAYGIVLRESGGRPDAFNGNHMTQDLSYGLFQINMRDKLGPARRQQYGLKSNEELFQPDVNARAAYLLSKGGRDFGAWGLGKNAYRSGAGINTIRQYLQEFDKWKKTGGKSGRPGAPPQGHAPRGDAFQQPSEPPQSRKVNWAAIFPDDPEFVQIMRNAPTKEVRAKGIVSPGGSVKKPPAAKFNNLIAAADTQIGKPYLFGSGPDTSSFDCSDLIQWAYKQIGIDIPRTTYDQIKIGKPVKWGEFQPGDLIFSNGGGHVVMYVGGGKVISAPYTGQVVQYQPVSRFKNSFVAGRRIL